MTALAQPLDTFISEQVSTGVATSEAEAEQLILSAVAHRTLDRKIAKAEEQIENGQLSEINEQFVDTFITRARKRNNL
jgi:hypothetical protein